MIIGFDTDISCKPDGFANEKELQDLIQKYPAILDPIAEMNRLGSSLMILSREFGVQAGAIDLLACDIDANIYLIETKLAENPQLRRTVIGQVIEYASNLRDLPFEHFKIRCETFLGQSLDNVVEMWLSKMVSEQDEDLTTTDFLKQLRKNLFEGQICVVVITNKINFEIQRLFNYLDETTRDKLNFLVLEVNKYNLAENSYLHSNVVWAAKYIRSLFSRKVIKETEYLQSKTPQVQEIIGFLDRWCTEKGLVKTATTKGISWKAETGGSIFVSKDWLDTNWSTIKADSNIFRQFKTEQVKRARDAGFAIHAGKHGGFRMRLTDTISKANLDLFLELAFDVLDKGRLENEPRE